MASLSFRETLELSGTAPATVQVGIEMVLNFLAPNEADRYIEAGGERHPLRWSASVSGSELRVVDLYQNAAVTLSAPGAREFWVSPIETVSDSEDGFERYTRARRFSRCGPQRSGPATPGAAGFR